MTRRTLATCIGGVLLAAACAGTPAPPRPGTTPAVIVRHAPLLPTTTDALPFMDPQGYATLLRQLEGIPLVVNFWASWCVPCEAEAPLLKDAAGRHGVDVQFIGVNILDARSDAERFIRDHALPYPSVFDPHGTIRDSVGSTGQPVTVFYGRDGAIAMKVDGQLSAQVLADGIAEIAE